MADIGMLALKLTADGSALFSGLDKVERAIGQADKTASASTMADRVEKNLSTVQGAAGAAANTIAGVFNGLAQGNLGGLEKAFRAAKDGLTGLAKKIFEQFKNPNPIEVKVKVDTTGIDAARKKIDAMARHANRLAPTNQAARGGVPAAGSGPAAAGIDAVSSSLAGLTSQAPAVASMGATIAGALGPVGVIAMAAAAGISAMTGSLFAAAKAGFDNIRTQTRIGQLFGISRAEAAGLQAAMAQVGTTFDVVDGPLGRLQRNLGRLRTGVSLGAVGGNMEGVAERFGVNARELSNLPLNESLGRIADRFNGIENASERAAFAEAMFGRQWESVVPLLRGGSEALSEATRRAQRLGIAVTDAEAAKVGSAHKALRSLGADVSALWDSFANRAAVYLAPVIERVAGALQTVVDSLGGWGPAMDLVVQVMAAPIEGLIQIIGYGTKFVAWAASTLTEIMVGTLRMADRVQQVLSVGLTGGQDSVTSRVANELEAANNRVRSGFYRFADTLLNGPTGRQRDRVAGPSTSALDREEEQRQRDRNLFEQNTSEAQAFLNSLNRATESERVVDQIARGNEIAQQIRDGVNAVLDFARSAPALRSAAEVFGLGPLGGA